MRNKDLQQLLKLYDDEAEIAIGTDVHGFFGPEHDFSHGPIWVDEIQHNNRSRLLIGRFMLGADSNPRRRTNSDHGIEQPNVYYARRSRER